MSKVNCHFKKLKPIINEYSFETELYDLQYDLSAVYCVKGNVSFLKIWNNLKHQSTEALIEDIYTNLKNKKDEIVEDLRSKKSEVLHQNQKTAVEEALHVILQDIQKTIDLKHQYIGKLKKLLRKNKSFISMKKMFEEHISEIGDQFDRIVSELRADEKEILDNMNDAGVINIIANQYEQKALGAEKQYNSILLQLHKTRQDLLPKLAIVSESGRQIDAENLSFTSPDEKSPPSGQSSICSKISQPDEVIHTQSVKFYDLQSDLVVLNDYGGCLYFFDFAATLRNEVSSKQAFPDNINDQITSTVDFVINKENSLRKMVNDLSDEEAASTMVKLMEETIVRARALRTKYTVQLQKGVDSLPNDPTIVKEFKDHLKDIREIFDKVVSSLEQQQKNIQTNVNQPNFRHWIAFHFDKKVEGIVKQHKHLLFQLAMKKNEIQLTQSSEKQLDSKVSLTAKTTPRKRPVKQALRRSSRQSKSIEIKQNASHRQFSSKVGVLQTHLNHLTEHGGHISLMELYFESLMNPERAQKLAETLDQTKDELINQAKKEKAELDKMSEVDAANNLLTEIFEHKQRTKATKMKLIAQLKDGLDSVKDNPKMFEDYNRQLENICDQFDKVIEGMSLEENEIQSAFGRPEFRQTMIKAYNRRIKNVQYQYDNISSQRKDQRVSDVVMPSLLAPPKLLAETQSGQLHYFTEISDIKSISEPIRRISSAWDVPVSLATLEIIESVNRVRGSIQSSVLQLEEIAKPLTSVEKMLREKQGLQSKIKQKKKELGRLKGSVIRLDKKVRSLSNVLGELKSERDNREAELEVKKEFFQDRLFYVTELNKLLLNTMRRIRDANTKYELRIEKLENEVQGILKRTDIPDVMKVKQVRFITDQIAKLKKEQVLELKVLEMEQKEREEDAKLIFSFCVRNLEMLMENDQQEIDRFKKALNMAKTESEKEAILEEIIRFKEKLEKDRDLMEAFRKNMYEQLTMPELRMTPSGRFLSHSGAVMTIEEAASKGLFKNIVYVTPSKKVITSSGKLITLEEANKRQILGPDLRFALHGHLATASGTAVNLEDAESKYRVKVRWLVQVKFAKFIFGRKGVLITTKRRFLNAQQIKRLGLDCFHYAYGYIYTPDGVRIAPSSLLDYGLVKLTPSGHVVKADEELRFDQKRGLRYTWSGNVLLDDGTKLNRTQAQEMGILVY